MRIASLVLALALASPGPSPVYQIDPDRSVVQFTITKLGFEDVVGTFKHSSGEIRWDPSNPGASSIRWRIDIGSVVTDATNRDRTLQGAEYFDARNHPQMIFESTTVRVLDANRLEVTGNLTIRGVTRQQIALVRHTGGAGAPVFETDFEVDRYDFGVAGGQVMGRLIGRKARIHLRAVTKEHTL
jgi:polyisoprenoid-binding protein YceI